MIIMYIQRLLLLCSLVLHGASQTDEGTESFEAQTIPTVKMLPLLFTNSHVFGAIKNGVREMIDSKQAEFMLNHIPEGSRQTLLDTLERRGHTFVEMQSDIQAVLQQSQNSLPRILAELERMKNNVNKARHQEFLATRKRALEEKELNDYLYSDGPYLSSDPLRQGDAFFHDIATQRLRMLQELQRFSDTTSLTSMQTENLLISVPVTISKDNTILVASAKKSTVIQPEHTSPLFSEPSKEEKRKGTLDHRQVRFKRKDDHWRTFSTQNRHISYKRRNRKIARRRTEYFGEKSIPTLTVIAPPLQNRHSYKRRNRKRARSKSGMQAITAQNTGRTEYFGEKSIPTQTVIALPLLSSNPHIFRAIQSGICEMIDKHQAEFTLGHIPEASRPLLERELAKIEHTFSEVQDEIQKMVVRLQNSRPQILETLKIMQRMFIDPREKQREHEASLREKDHFFTRMTSESLLARARRCTRAARTRHLREQRAKY
ncbi:MAG: hypothetical protein OXC30_04210 [Alphaproteobacteria bacterium]|nr:hypothetical protein [Alphaproteobacteria bacterium]